MSLLAATIRETKTKGEVKSLRSKGMVPGIIYGGEEPNQKISVSVKEVKNLLSKENILSNIEMYLHYRRDITQLPVPLNRPKYISDSGTRTNNNLIH